MPQFHTATTEILSDSHKTQGLITAIQTEGIDHLEINLEDAYKHGGKSYKAAAHNPIILENLEELLDSLYGNFQIKDITYKYPNDRDPEEQYMRSGIAGIGAGGLGGTAGFIGGMLISLGHALIGAPLSGLWNILREGLKANLKANLAPFPLITGMIGGLAGLAYFMKIDDDQFKKTQPSTHCAAFNAAVTTLHHTKCFMLYEFSSLDLEKQNPSKNDYTKELAARLKNVINDEEEGCLDDAQKCTLWAQYKDTPAGQLLTQQANPVSTLKTLIFNLPANTAEKQSPVSADSELRQRRESGASSTLFH